jgi:hypothetical protein
VTATKEVPRALGYSGPREFAQILDLALRKLDGDERAGALMRATGIRMRIEISDVASVLNVASVPTGSHHISWTFDDSPDWEPRLVMRLDSEIANRFLQGRESLAIAVARGRVKVEGDPRFTLLYVPALRLLVEPYRAAVREHSPDLVVD